MLVFCRFGVCLQIRSFRNDINHNNEGLLSDLSDIFLSVAVDYGPMVNELSLTKACYCNSDT